MTIHRNWGQPIFGQGRKRLTNATHVTRPDIRCRSSNLVLKLFSAMSKESWQTPVGKVLKSDWCRTSFKDKKHLGLLLLPWVLPRT